MGAWEYGLFQNDKDLDIVQDLDVETGLKQLEKEMQAKAKQNDVPIPYNGADPSIASEADSEAEKILGSGVNVGYIATMEGCVYVGSNMSGKADNACNSGKHKGNQSGISLTIYNGGSDPATVRKHLDSNGTLTTLIHKYATKCAAPVKIHNRDDPCYNFVILGACAMTVGCHLPANFKITFKNIYREVGLAVKGLQQMKKALYGPDGFKDGTPYDFQSLGLLETAEVTRMSPGRSPNQFGLCGLNVMGPPGTIAWKGVDAHAHKLVKEGMLLVCGRYNKRRYCGKDCQKAHWRTHKKVCTAATSYLDELD